MNSRFKISIAFWANAFVVTLIVSYLIWQGYREAKQLAETTTQNYAAIIEARLEATLRRADAVLIDLMRSIPVAALHKQAVPRYARQINVDLDLHMASFNEVDGIRVFDADGDMIYTSDSAATKHTNIYDRAYFQKLRSQPEAGIMFSETVTSRATGRQTIALSRALRDGQGNFRGIVLVSVQLEYFNQLFQLLNIGVQGVIAIFRKDEFVLAFRWPPNTTTTGRPLAKDHPARKAVEAGQTAFTGEFPSALDGIVRIFNIHVLEKYPYYVSVGLARTEVLAGWQARSLVIGLCILLLEMVLFGALYRLRRSEASREAQKTLIYATFENAAVGVVHIALSGQYGLVNPKFCAMLGYTREELLKMGPRDITFGDDRIAGGGFMETLLRGESEVVSAEKRYVRKNGQVIWVNLTLSVVADSTGKPKHFIGIVEEISQQKEVESSYAATFEEAGVGIAHIAVTTDCVLKANRKFCELLGYTQDEMIGLNSSAWRNSGELEKQEVLTRGPLLAGTIKMTSADRCWLRKDGAKVWINRSLSLVRDAAGGPLYFITIAQDISEKIVAQHALKKAAEDLEKRVAERTLELKRSESRLGFLLSSTPATIYTCSVEPPYATTYVSPNVSNALGYTVDEFLATPDFWKDHIHPEDIERVFAGLQQVFEDGKHAIEYRMQKKSGDWIWVYDELCVAGYPDNAVAELIGYFIEITARRKMEEAIESSSIEAQRSNQAKSQFLTRMSHELRTPLNSLLGYAQIMSECAVDMPIGQERKSIEAISKSGWYLLRIITDLLDLAAIEGNKIEMYFENVQLQDVLDECFVTIEPMAKAHSVEIKSAQVPHGLVLRADRFRLRQVLINLLVNAVKYNRSGGKVEIECKRSQTGRIQVCVTDTGIGIQAEDIPALFEPFSRFHGRSRSIEGIGLGLTIAKRLVELMNGTIQVESVAGQGSKFWIELDAGVEAEPVLVAAPQNARPPESTVHLKMLYIEDTPSHVDLMRRIIEKMGDIEMLVAHSPSVGLDLAQAHMPDFILSDISLPEMDGDELIKRLNSNKRTMHIPVMAISANAMPRDIEMGLRAGFCHYFTKPLDIARFRTIVLELLESRTGMKG